MKLIRLKNDKWLCIAPGKVPMSVSEKILEALKKQLGSVEVVYCDDFELLDESRGE